MDLQKRSSRQDSTRKESIRKDGPKSKRETSRSRDPKRRSKVLPTATAGVPATAGGPASATAGGPASATAGGSASASSTSSSTSSSTVSLMEEYDSCASWMEGSNSSIQESTDDSKSSKTKRDKEKEKTKKESSTSSKKKKNQAKDQEEFLGFAPQGICKPDRVKTSCAALYNSDNMPCVSACLYLLEQQIRKASLTQLTYTPEQKFSNEQICLACTEIHQYIENQIITHMLIRDIIENMFYLMGKISQNDVLIALKQVKLLNQVTICITEVCHILESIAGVGITDWPLIGDSYYRKTLSLQAETTPQGLYGYVPVLQNFGKVTYLAGGTYSDVYRVLPLFCNIPMTIKISPLSKFGTVEDMSVASAYIDRAVAAIATDFTSIRILCCFLAKPDHLLILAHYPEDSYSLDRVLNLKTQLNENAVGLFAIQIVLGIENLHLNGFIHRDINPSNLLLLKSGHIKLIDFDKCKVCRGHFTTTKVLMGYFRRTSAELTGDAVGLLEYTAPELLRRSKYGRSVDWWSLGITIYRMMVGKVPFREANPDKLKEMIVKEPYYFPRVESTKHTAKPIGKEFVYDLLRKNPSRRLGSASYAAIKQHAYFLDYVNRLDVRVLLKKNNSLEKPRQRVFYNETICNMESLIQQVKPHHFKATPGRLKFSDLKDETIDRTKQLRLLCYVNEKFRKLMDRIKGEGPFHPLKMAEHILPCTPPIPDFDYHQPTTDSIYQISVTVSRELERNADQHRTKTNLPYGTVNGKRSLLVEFDLVEGDAKLALPLVKKLNHKAAISTSNIVVEGDVLLSINQQDARGTSLAHIEKYIHTLLIQTTKDEGTIECEVYSYTVFRLKRSDPVTLCNILKTSTRQCVTLTRPSDGNKDLLKTVALKVRNSELRCDMIYHVITHVSSHARVSERTSVLYGDVVKAINDVNCVERSDVEVRKLIHSKNSIKLEFMKLSVLRRRDMLEVDPKLKTKSE